MPFGMAATLSDFFMSIRACSTTTDEVFAMPSAYRKSCSQVSMLRLVLVFSHLLVEYVV